MKKFFTLFTIFFLISCFTELKAQNPGNACSGATAITVGGCASGGTHSITDATVNDAPAPSCGSPSLDGWYKFVATTTAATITAVNTNRNLGIQILSGACGSLTEIGCSDNFGAGASTESVTVYCLTVGTTYYIRIMDDGAGASMSVSSVCVATATPLTAPNCPTLNNPVNGATGVCNAGATIDWSAAATGSTPTSYLLFFGTNNPPTNINNGTNIGNVLSYSFGALLPNTTYYWKIVPTNCAGNAAGCTVYSFTTGSGCFLQTTGGSYSACGGTFYDSGGSALNYSDGENSNTTICPSTAGQFLSVSFNSFTLESCCDNLTIYNGNSTGAPLIGTYTGSTIPPCSIASSAANGCLTFHFHSDGSLNFNGWDATLSCLPSPPIPPTGSLCSNAPAITLPYSATGQTTLCYGDDYNNLSTGSCLTLYESGEDRVYSLTVASAQCILISLTNCNTSNVGYEVYSGCPGSAGASCIGSNGGANPLTGSVVLPAAGTYYIVVDTWSSPSSVDYDIAVSSMGAGPANDLPCNFSSLALNTNLTGDNSCSGNSGEPATPACWGTGTVNTVWYRVLCPASGQLTIRTTLGSLSNTQIALFSGTCGPGLTLVQCNDDAPACGTSIYSNSQITATGLTAGNFYFIAVDGSGNLTGTFDIMAVDGTVGFPPAAGQDCGTPNPVCAQSISIGNPGYQAYGNICDFPGGGTNCLASGERGSAWYNIPINAAGNLTFDIVPNDYTGGNGCCSTDYDFAVWKLSGAGATTCAGIAGGATPIRCNYSGLGVTGCFSAANGTSPAAYPGYGGAYMAQIPVVAGEVYELVISNFSNSTSGFTVNFGPTSPINYTAAGSSINWSGGTNTSWTLPNNWGGCSIPACGIDATIVSGPANQPILVAGTYNVNNITINAGATLTLLNGANLHICGNFINNGSLVANPGSTLTFDNAATAQTISGALVGPDKVGNLVVTKTGGSLTFGSNIDIGGNFTTTNGTSVCNFNNKYVRIAGNFNNFNGATTVTTVGIGTLEFNGTAAQTYNQGASLLTLNSVLMNHTGPGVTCLTNMVIGTAGVLTLTAGKIITNAFEVQVTDNVPAACTAGNATSFVQGNLRRYLNGAAGSFDLPVGEATKGYQLANINFTTATTIPQLLAFFSTWSPIVNGPAASECPSNTYNVLQALNNGYWTITASANPTSGTYNTTLHSTNYTNSGGAAGWTVMKAPTIAGAWGLNGVCVAASTASNTQRTGMNGFSVFAVAQSVSPLPVEITEFTGTAEADFNRLKWTTATENNNQYFTLERSTDGSTFTEIGRVNGAGNSTQLIDYYFNDMNPNEGTNYYRLKQTDYNGQSTWSNMIALDFHRGYMSVSNVRPNPTSGEVNFDFASPEETEIHFIITDVTGRIVTDERKSVKAGITTLGTLIPNEGAGVYSLKVVEEKHGFISVSRIVKY